MDATKINRREMCNECGAEWWSAPHNSGMIHPRDHVAPDGDPCQEARYRWNGSGDYTRAELDAIAADYWGRMERACNG